MTLLSQLIATVRTVVLNSDARVRAGWRLVVCLVLCTIGWAVGGLLYSRFLDDPVADIGQIVVFVGVIVIAHV